MERSLPLLSHLFEYKLEVVGVNPLDKVASLVGIESDARLIHEVANEGGGHDVLKFGCGKCHVRPPFGSPVPYNTMIALLG